MPYADPVKQKEYLSAYRLRYMHRLRQEWIAENGPCVQCGSAEQLEVDHIDPTTKDPRLGPAGSRMWSWGKEARAIELAKCQVLCHTCHNAKTALQLHKGVCNWGHLMTPENTYLRGNGWRECRTCRNERRRVGFNGH